MLLIIAAACAFTARSYQTAISRCVFCTLAISALMMFGELSSFQLQLRAQGSRVATMDVLALLSVNEWIVGIILPVAVSVVMGVLLTAAVFWLRQLPSRFSGGKGRKFVKQVLANSVATLLVAATIALSIASWLLPVAASIWTLRWLGWI